MPGTLFVSDLHLDLSRPQITRLFLDFLSTRGRDADAVYILGDLFEIWLGDDDDNPVGDALVAGIRACAASGTTVYLMRGNRDFLIGERFAARSGCRLLDEPARIDLYGTPVLLMHGDLLCTDDVEYQRFRCTVRDPCWQQAFLRESLEARRYAAQSLRMHSRTNGCGKPDTLKDVNPETVLQYMARYGVRLLIHGHTHRPGLHTFEIAGKPARRMVLGEWHRHGNVLECTQMECRLQDIPAD